MSDLFDTANDFIESMRTAYGTRTVTYKRGTYSLDLLATLGSTTIEAEGVDAHGVRCRVADFLITAADLVTSSGKILVPELGDIIVTTLGGVEYEFRTRALVQELVCWRWSDQYNTCRRIHTVAIKGAE